VQLLLNSDAHKIQQRTVGTAATKSEESCRLLFDLSEGVIRRDADRKIDGPTIASTKESAARIWSEERRLQQAFLRREGEHGIRHATTLDPRGSHLRYYIAQPARMDPATRSEIGDLSYPRYWSR